MRHAYLIIAHNNWEQLKLLMSLLDSKNSDIYIHVNSKVQMPNLFEIMGSTKNAEVFFSERVPVIWGNFGICEASIKLIECAKNNGNYDYFHLLTGSDLPIKSIKEIEDFFEKNQNNNKSATMKSNYISCKKPNERMKSRIIHYNILIPLWGNKKFIIRKFATVTNHLFCLIQKVLKIDRFKTIPYEIYQGSSWWSISDDFAQYVLENIDWIEKQFRNMTFAADEFVFQTLLMNSGFKDSMYIAKSNQHNNLRLLNFERGNGYGSPYIWTIKEKEEIINTSDLFARKFNKETDNEIIKFLSYNINESRDA